MEIDEICAKENKEGVFQEPLKDFNTKSALMVFINTLRKYIEGVLKVLTNNF